MDSIPTIWPLTLSAILFGIGVYGVLARKNGVMILASVELMLNACNVSFITFGAGWAEISGQIFAIFVIAVAAAEVAVGLGIILLVYRNRVNVDVDELDLMKG